MSDKISYAMRLALAAMTTDEWRCAYEIGAALNTLDALQLRGLVRSRNKTGYISFPRINIEWQITDKGKRAQEVTA